MPRPVSRSATYVPALDGIRALAVSSVVLYHLGVPGFDGGLLGVGMFFTLSGFLITLVLLRSWRREQRPGLGQFYLRRARRLLPALVLVLVVVLVATWVSDRETMAQRWGQAAAGLFYFANWHTIASGDSYFARTAGPGPLDHLWSLSIEEQFYLVWPLLLLALLAVCRGNVARVVQVTLGLAAVSFGLLFALHQPGFDQTRAYEGTDTRAGGLLIGAALALVVFARPLRRVAWPWRVALEVVGVGALWAIWWLVGYTGDNPASLYTWGLLALSVATAALVLVVVHPGSLLVARLLALAPLRWVGERSYGIYLWHLPVIVFTPPLPDDEHPVLLQVAQVLITLFLATVSWQLLEDPIRRRGFRAAFRPGRVLAPGMRRARPVIVTGFLVLGSVAGLGLGTAAALGNAAGAGGGAAADLSATALPPVPPDTTPAPSGTSAPVPSTTPTGTASSPAPTSSATSSKPPSSAPTKAATPAPAKAPTSTPTGPQTSCTAVAHIGDSTSIGLMSPAYLPDPAKRIDARYRAVGAQVVRTDISGARSIVERYQSQPNAEEAVEALVATGFRGCWVIAMGNNEVANQVVGGVVPLDQRIDRIMRHLAGQPVMWTTTRTLMPTGPYADKRMPQWSAALVVACGRYPAMRVYDWRVEAQDGWYISDRMHFTSAGYTQRAARIAAALTQAFPKGKPASAACVVRSGL